MAMTCAMEDVMYDRKNFNYDSRLHRHPMHATERHYIYHLKQDDSGFLVFQRRAPGEHPIVSPRKLRDITINYIINEPKLMQREEMSRWQQLPANVYPLLLTEGIMLRETQAIVWLVSIWPTKVLRVFDLIPLEDNLHDDYLTIPVENNSEMALVDCFVLGLLKLKPECNLKCIDFSGFEKDRKLCRELCRLPILWMKPEERTVEKIHDSVSDVLDVTKDKVQRFLNRISVVYSNLDMEFKHGNKIEPVTVFVDLQVTLDDIPLGLCLQHLSPFRFLCSRLWMIPVLEVGLLPAALTNLVESKRITHFEYKDGSLPTDEIRTASIIQALGEMRNLFGFSFPCSIDVEVNPQMATHMNNALRRLRYLQRINFSYCNLKGRLSTILSGLTQRLNYLNLKDCRLDECDLFFLVSWRPLTHIRELELSSNNLEHLDQCVIAILQRMPAVSCFSVAYCSLDTHSQVLVVQEAKECSRLKVLCMQGYTPLPEDDILEMLHICYQIPTLQRLTLFPEAYAFPGNDDAEREMNKLHALSVSYRYLELRKRDDIELE